MTLQLAGAPVKDAVGSNGLPIGLRLWNVDQPLRVLSRVSGVQQNGDIFQAARITGFGCRAADVLHFTLVSKADEEVDFYRGGFFERAVQLSPPKVYSGTIPAQPDEQGRCSFSITTTGLLGSTVLRVEHA